jgi:hypothetical protein
MNRSKYTGRTCARRAALTRSGLAIAFIAALFLLSNHASYAQNCIDGLPIRPTYTSGSGQQWGSAGVAVLGSDVLLATNIVSSGTVAVMRLSGTSGVTQQAQIATGDVDVLRAAGDTFFVGSASTSNGSVRVYRRQTTGSYSLATTINGPVAGEGFGDRLAVNEDATVLVVGARAAGTAPNAAAGKAYVYARNITTGAWALEATLQSPSGPVFNTYFGTTVSASGQRVAVSEGGSASVRIYLRTGAVWALENSVANSSGSTSTSWGRIVYLSGDTLWLRDDQTARFDVFGRSGTSWPLQQTLVLNNVSAMGFANGVMCTSTRVDSPVIGIQVQAFRRSGTQQQWANFASVYTPAFSGNNVTYHLAMMGDLVAIDGSYFGNGSVPSYGAGFLFDINFTDCNGNGVRDECDIASGTAADTNSNGVLDSCENLCRMDVNGDGVVNGADLGLVLGAWGACTN